MSLIKHWWPCQRPFCKGGIHSLEAQQSPFCNGAKLTTPLGTWIWMAGLQRRRYRFLSVTYPRGDLDAVPVSYYKLSTNDSYYFQCMPTSHCHALTNLQCFENSFPPIGQRLIIVLGKACTYHQYFPPISAIGQVPSRAFQKCTFLCIRPGPKSSGSRVETVPLPGQCIMQGRDQNVETENNVMQAKIGIIKHNLWAIIICEDD